MNSILVIIKIIFSLIRKKKKYFF